MIRKTACLILLLSSGLFLSSKGQKIASLSLEVPDVGKEISIPVQINLDEVTFLPESEITLVELVEGKEVEIPYQVKQGEQRMLHWLVKRNASALKNRTYELIKKAPTRLEAPVELLKNQGSLTIQTKDKKLLNYHYQTSYPPEGIDTAYKRSGFIHPLWTPHGQSLTRINAPDHYHHYGLWNPWTRVLFEGDTLDLWNLKDEKGTVRFADFVSMNAGQIFGEYQALHEHVAFTKKGEKVALNELQTVRVYQMEEHQNYYLADITIQLNCASESPVVLQEYRYGGLGWRATEKWNKDNSETLTSQGKGRVEADGSNARWVIVQGSLDQDYGGAVMMSYPSNYNHPEPLRIWPEDSNGTGDVFANFSPTKDKDWVLNPGHNYVLKYRFLVFNDKLTKDKAEVAWQDFANPPKVTVTVFTNKD